jgi:hypothetical protein
MQPIHAKEKGRPFHLTLEHSSEYSDGLLSFLLPEWNNGEGRLNMQQLPGIPFSMDSCCR